MRRLVGYVGPRIRMLPLSGLVIGIDIVVISGIVLGYRFTSTAAVDFIHHLICFFHSVSPFAFVSSGLDSAFNYTHANTQRNGSQTRTGF